MYFGKQYDNNSLDLLPDEMLVEICSYLSRRDLLACSLVSYRWQRALDCPSLWENMTVLLDVDLMEPSTALLTRQYYRHIKNLELTWSKPQLPAGWIPHRFQEISKRACRYVIILKESFVQLQSIKLHDWYEICRFKKLIYLLSQFLRNQTGLQSISFCNAHLQKNDFMKLLISCRSCEYSLKHLNAHNAFFHYNEPLLSVQLISCLELFENLVIIILDYSTLCREIISSLLNTKSTALEFLEVHIQDVDIHKTITEEYWKELKMKFPKLKVAIYFHHINNLKELNFVFRKEIPLTALQLCFGLIPTEKEYKELLKLICQYYMHSLEIIRLDISNNELIFEIVLRILNKCSQLKNLEFYGVVDFNICQELFNKVNEKGHSHFKYFHLTTENISNEKLPSIIHNKFIQLSIEKEPRVNSIHV